MLPTFNSSRSLLEYSENIVMYLSLEHDISACFFISNYIPNGVLIRLQMGRRRVRGLCPTEPLYSREEHDKALLLSEHLGGFSKLG